jgi:4-amino-4-deoxy-L-arabinose transferase-like glycosyltransferase
LSGHASSSRIAWLATPAGFAVLLALVIVGIDLLTIGAAGPWDPWETHYGEVARQILVRHDPMDLWWQPGNGGPDGEAEKSFASKPALAFWSMALSMKVFGVGTSADPSELVRSPLPELAIRLPSMLAGWLGAVVLGLVTARLASPRAGVLTGVVLATMPQFAIVTRQALTDQFFVVPVIVAAGAYALAWLQDDRDLGRRGRGWASVPWDRAWVVFAIVFVLAALVPLFVLHQHAFDAGTWARVGKMARRAEGLRGIQEQMFLYWGFAAIVLVASLRWRKRSQPLMGIVYVCGGLSLLGKGLIGPGLIGVLVLGHLVLSGRWDILRRCGLPTGILIFAIVALPWHHAMALYRGERWVNELIFENNLRRFETGEQKQAVGDFGYYLETLGIAALPWSAIAPIAAFAGLRAYGEPPTNRGVELQRFAMLWLGVSLFAIGFSTTKYYHYLLPCLPPLAVLVGVWLDRAMEERDVRRSTGMIVAVLVGLAILALVVRDVLNAPAWIAHLTTYLYTGMWLQGAPSTGWLAVTAGVFALGLLAWPFVRRELSVAAFVLSGVLTTGWIIGDYLPAASESWSQRRAMQLWFDGRGPDDRLVSWWFYYRGETWFTKGDVWVMKDPDRQALAELVEKMRGRGAALWFVTTVQHSNRVGAQLPADVRRNLEEVYSNFHYALLRADVP